MLDGSPRNRIVGDKVIKKQAKKHPSNEKMLAGKAAAKVAAVAVAAAKPAGPKSGK